MADRVLKKGDTTPALRFTFSDGIGPLPLGDADRVEIFIRKPIDAGADLLVSGECTVVAPAARRTFDGDRWTFDDDLGEAEYEIEAADFTAVGTDYECEGKVTWDAASVPPRVTHHPNRRSANPRIDVDENLEVDERP